MTQNPLSRSTMLVHLKVRVWTGRRRDFRVVASAAAAYNAKAQVITGGTHLLPPSKEMSKMLSAEAKLRDTSARLTLPWLDNGTRVLSAKAYWKYQTDVGAAVTEFQGACQMLEQAYPVLKAKAPMWLGDLYSANEYPASLLPYLGAEVLFLPFPNASDFRVDDLAEAEQEAIREKMSSMEGMLSDRARQEVAERVTKVAAEVSKKLKGYTGSREGSFRDSLIENVRELCDIIPLLNPTSDSAVQEMLSDLQGLAIVEPEDLRKDKGLRDVTAAQADDILKKMEAFI